MTRNEEGEFGTWWGIRGHDSRSGVRDVTEEDGFELPWDEGTDYRNEGVPGDEIWRRPEDQIWELSKSDHDGVTAVPNERFETQDISRGTGWDPNNRGRGRTVETQSGGLAILRALWKVVDVKR